MLREVLTALNVPRAQEVSDEALLELLRANKTTCAAAFAARIGGNTDLAQRAPAAFRTAIHDLRSLE